MASGATRGAVRMDTRFRSAVREFLFGMFGYETSHQAVEIRASLETMFMLITFGDMIGVPVLPPYFGLRLLPYVVPQISAWQRRVLRDREFLSGSREHELHGV